MKNYIEYLKAALYLLFKAVIIAATWAGKSRKSALEDISKMDTDEKDKEILFLRDFVSQLQTQVAILQKQRKKDKKKPRYMVKEKLFIIWAMAYYQIPSRKVTEYYGIARSTYYRWLKKIDEASSVIREPVNKTSREIAALIWEIAQTNIDWGRVKIANQLAILNIFIAASTVRNILNRPKPKKDSPQKDKQKKDESTDVSRSIPAWYPNHVWSIDLTIVLIWRLWPIYVLVAIDHYSRKVVCVEPLEGPNAAWVIDATERAFENHGAPKHIISDQGTVFTSDAFDALMKDKKWGVKQRFGALHKHGSIAVTERIIKSLKYEWLNHVLLIKGFDHLSKLCSDFSEWYNVWRPHMFLDGARPDYVFYSWVYIRPRKDDKTVPANIEKKVFDETRVTGYRLKEAA